MPQVKAPTLMGYDTAIQANQSMSNAFKQLSDTSQNYLNYSENKKQNAFNNQHQTDVLNETKNQNENRNQQWLADYTARQNDSETKNNQWQQDYLLRKDNNEFDQNYKTKMLDHTISQDGFSNYFKQAQLDKPDYTTVDTVVAGVPTLALVDKNSGKVTNTNTPLYKAPKELAPEQALYYQDKAYEMKQKALSDMEKQLYADPSFSKMSNDDQVKATAYLRQNGKMPSIAHDGGWLGKGYYFNQPMSEGVSQVQQTATPVKNTTPASNTNADLSKVEKQMDSLAQDNSSPKIYADRNSRDLMKAREWADGVGADHIRHIWNPTDKTKLEYYYQYGKNKGE